MKFDDWLLSVDCAEMGDDANAHIRRQAVDSAGLKRKRQGDAVTFRV